MVEVNDALAQVVAETVAPVKANYEFTIADFQARVQVEKHVKLSRRQAEYRLDKQVQVGGLDRGQRLDPRTGREVLCYWRPEDAETDD